MLSRVCMYIAVKLFKLNLFPYVMMSKAYFIPFETLGGCILSHQKSIFNQSMKLYSHVMDMKHLVTRITHSQRDNELNKNTLKIDCVA